MTPEHKKAFNNQVDAAATVEKVHQAVVDAKNADGTDQAAQALAAAKAQAHATVNALGHLTPEHKKAFNNQVDAADTVEKVHQAAVDAAQKQDETDRQAAIDDAIKHAGVDKGAAVVNSGQGAEQVGGSGVSPQADARHASQGGRHLAQTGRPFATLVGVSASLFVAGAAVVAVARRRKKHF